MEYREHETGQALRPFVECFWTLSSGGEPAPAEAGTILPDGSVEIVLSFADPVRRGPDAPDPGSLKRMVVGQLDGLQRVAYDGKVDLLGARFLPGGAHALLGIPMDAISRRILSLDALSAGLDRRLDSRLDPGASDERRIAVLEETLLAHLAHSRLRDPGGESAARAIRMSHGCIPISTLAGELGISVRQLERRFGQVVGIAPKLLSRIFRFRRVWEEAARKTPASWAELAGASGYSDQAHLIRDFQAFSGETPSQAFPRSDDES